MILELNLILIQNPIVLFLLSTMGSWLVITQIWEPYQKRMEIKQNLISCRNEALSRLRALEMSCNKKWSDERIIDFLYGNVSIDRNLREWKISYLVHFGWSETIYEKTIKPLTELENLAQHNQTMQSEEKTIKSKQLLYNLQVLLKNDK